LTEWKVLPSVLNDEWTPELLWLMFHERRLELERANEPPEEKVYMSDVELFEKMGIKTTRA